jgi:methionine synthase II (cobalamin-independent)
LERKGNRIRRDLRALAQHPRCSLAPRAGDFGPLHFVPKDKGVVLGLVSSKTPDLETIDPWPAGVDEAALFTERDRLAIGPQCGLPSRLPATR